MTPLGAGFWPFVRIIYFAFSRFLSVKKPSSAWSCPTSKNFKIFEKFEHRPFTWYMVLWGLNAYLALWKQKYTSQKFSKKYKNPYFGPTLELVKITMVMKVMKKTKKTTRKSWQLPFHGENFAPNRDRCWF